jgi:hypothetical protein
MQAYNDLGVGVFLWECINTQDEKVLRENLSKILKINKKRTYATILLPQKYNREKRNEENEQTLKHDENFFEDIVFDVEQQNNLMLYERTRDLDDFGIVRGYLNVLISKNTWKYPVEIWRDERHFLEPSSLLSFMWFQLGLALDRKIRLRRCEVCGEWEDMENHRENWTKHPKCADNKRAERYRNKKRIGKSKA